MSFACKDALFFFFFSLSDVVGLHFEIWNVLIWFETRFVLITWKEKLLLFLESFYLLPAIKLTSKKKKSTDKKKERDSLRK